MNDMVKDLRKMDLEKEEKEKLPEKVPEKQAKNKDIGNRDDRFPPPTGRHKRWDQKGEDANDPKRSKVNEQEYGHGSNQQHGDGINQQQARDKWKNYRNAPGGNYEKDYRFNYIRPKTWSM